jgi:hypothetical protein
VLGVLVGAALLDVPVDVADDLAHVLEVRVGELVLVLALDRDDPPAGVVADRLAAAAAQSCGGGGAGGADSEAGDGAPSPAGAAPAPEPPNVDPICPSARVNSVGMTQILFASPCASWGSICRYW